MSTIREIFGLREVTPFTYPTHTPAVVGSNPELIMGIEVEAEHLPHRDRWYNERCAQYGWATKTDGSLRGQNNERRAGREFERGNAYEFVTHPLRQRDALSAIRVLMNAGEIADDAFESDRTSIHVHANVQDKDPGFLKGLIYLYTVMERCLFNFVGHNRDQNIYCVPLHSTYLPTQVNQYKDPRELTQRWVKYTALNLIPMGEYGTVEFRHMHGTNDVDKLVKWLQIIGRLFRKSETSFKELREEIFALNTTSAYEKLFKEIFGNDVEYTRDYEILLEEGVLAAKMTEAQTVISIAKKAEAPEPRADARGRFILEGWMEAAPQVQVQAVAGGGGRIGPQRAADPQPLARGNPLRAELERQRNVMMEEIQAVAALRQNQLNEEQNRLRNEALARVARRNNRGVR